MLVNVGGVVGLCSMIPIMVEIHSLLLRSQALIFIMDWIEKISQLVLQNLPYGSNDTNIIIKNYIYIVKI